MKFANLLFLLTLVTISLNAQTAFKKGVYVGEKPFGGILEILTTDLDNDGDEDLLGFSEYEMKWIENLGGENFAQAEHLFDLASPMLDIVAGDINNDGFIDLAMLLEAYPEQLIFYKGQVNGLNLNPIEFTLKTRDRDSFSPFATLQVFENSLGETSLFLRYQSDTEIIRKISITGDELTEGEPVTGIEPWLLPSNDEFTVLDLNKDDAPDFIIRTSSFYSPNPILLLSAENNTYRRISIFLGTPNYLINGLQLAGMVFTDANLDGYLDIITTTYGNSFSPGSDRSTTGYVDLFINSGDTTFTHTGSIDSTDRGFYRVFEMDVDNDGTKDLVVTNHPNKQRFSALGTEILETYWYRNEENGYYGERQLFGEYINGISADINEDGLNDIVAISDKSVKWYRSNGQGIDAAVTLSDDEPSMYIDDHIRTGDLDRNGLNDIVFTTLKGVYWYRNQGGLSFSEAIPIDATISDINEMEVLDVNKDGNLDIIISSSRYFSNPDNQYYSSSNLQVFFYEGNGNGSFNKQTIVDFPFGETIGSHDIALGDFDADGDIDLVLRNNYEFSLLKSESGTFGSQLEPADSLKNAYQVDRSLGSVVAADIDGNSGDEIVTTYNKWSFVYGSIPRIVSFIQVLSYSADSSGFFPIAENEINSRDRYSEFLYANDSDNDGKAEIFRTTSDFLMDDGSYSGGNPGVYSVAIQGESMGFNYTSFGDYTTNSRGIFPADLDRDGDIDLVNTNFRRKNSPIGNSTTYFGGTVEWFEQVNDTTFIKHSAIDSLTRNLTSVLVSDLNNDSFPEIIVGEVDNDRIAIYENQIFTVSNEELNSEAPIEITLSQNYPNPFNPSTVISYQLPVSSTVRLSVFDILGREVAVLADERMTAGNHQIQFDGARLASGVYFYRLQATDQVKTRRMILIK